MAAEPDIPERSGPSLDALPGGLEGPFFREVGKRKRQSRDVKVLITAKDGQTGVGKSNLSDFLAYVLDTSADGFSSKKATIDPGRFLQLYDILPPGSALVMEEGEQFDARRSNAHENVDATHKWQMARVRELCCLINLPSPREIDSRFERLADYWIDVKRRGFAVIYEKHIHPTKQRVYYERCQTLEWPNMDKSKTFKAMARMKDGRLDDNEADDNYVRESEVRERVAKAKQRAEQEVRNTFLTTMYRHTELTAPEIAELPAVDISAGRIRQIANDYN